MLTTPARTVSQKPPPVRLYAGMGAFVVPDARLLPLAALLLGLLSCVEAQVLRPQEIEEPSARALQERYLPQLQSLGQQLQLYKYPFAFYFSQTLDLNEAAQRQGDQRSIRFEKYSNQMALEITGNYYASYSADRMTGNQRARQTFTDVVMPMLKAAVAKLGEEESVQVFAFEIAHHVRRKVMGVPSEIAENVVLLIPREVALKLVVAASTNEMQNALLECDAFLDGEHVNLWLGDDQTAPPVTALKVGKPAASLRTEGEPDASRASNSSTLQESLSAPSGGSTRLITPQDLSQLKTEHQDTIARFLSVLTEQAHFVAYSPPAFIAFHQGPWLQVSLATELQNPASTSHSYLAAMAFDNHIAQLVHPMLSFFPANPDFDGISFSTAIKVPGSESSEAVEFFLPFRAMRCFDRFDCTGQQMLDAGYVLINGERAELNLQVAENTR